MYRWSHIFTKNPLAKVLPGYFQQSYWRMTFGVTNPRSTEHQVQHALKLLEQIPQDEKVFLFLNVSAIHGPNRYFVEGAREDSVETQRAALRYVDQALGPLFDAMGTYAANVLSCIFGSWNSLWRRWVSGTQAGA